MKFIYFLSACALTLATACNEQPAAETHETETKTVETHETYVDTVRVVETPPPAQTPPPAEEKGTSVNIGPSGTSVKTKNVNVEINKK
jgi:hypothetical protein